MKTHEIKISDETLDEALRDWTTDLMPIGKDGKLILDLEKDRPEIEEKSKPSKPMK